MGLDGKVRKISEDDAFDQEEEIFRSHLKRIHDTNDKIPNGFALYKLINPCLAIVTHLNRKETYHNGRLGGYLGFIGSTTNDLEEAENSPGKTVGLVARYLLNGDARLAREEAKLYNTEELIEEHPEGVIFSPYCDEGAVDLVKDTVDTDTTMDYSELEQLMTFLQQPDNAELCIEMIKQAGKAYDNDPRDYGSVFKVEGVGRQVSYFIDVFSDPTKGCPHAERYFKLLIAADGDDECEEHPLVLTNLQSVGDA
jgi:hypothetical protein